MRRSREAERAPSSNRVEAIFQQLAMPLICDAVSCASSPCAAWRLQLETAQFWAGLRRAREATASLRAAQAALWGA